MQLLLYILISNLNTICDIGLGQLSTFSSHLNFNKNLSLVYLHHSEIIQIIFKLWKSSYLKDENKTYYKHFFRYNYKF